MSEVLPREGSSKGFWVGVVGSGAIWALQLQTLYSLTPMLCRHDMNVLPHVLTAIFLSGAAVCGLLSWHDYRHVGAGDSDETGGGPIARTRFLGMLGTLVSVMFFLLILAQGIASFFLNACWT
jgi:hypothetical protein